ncbi:hypothetical protein SUGI_0601910 [Cryptomeria japonica]|uniref:probable plastid-lipid-associated protein 11, chloroplastic n=1 Tax=Cryptomeria japonica TaxID=3369 RepID=UPI0024149FC3|nr:probable plastid-lipid-associated protein 11, chloroplastic [Cryptomeria japonica]GLJ30413.1 hypothetical protein SUGI_0601910 [Cryptomeria japonica]
MAVAINPSTCIVCSRFPHNIHSHGIASKKKLRVISSSDVAPSANREAISARDNLLNLISGEERGLKTQKSPSKRSQIINAIDALAAFGTDTVTTDSKLSGTWRMMWTTEKEQLFIIEKAHLFGTQVGDILQVIDVNRSTLNNVITFPPSGSFVVDSTIQIVSSQRVNFRFTSAVLQGANWKIPLPPFGQGWFETVYLDEKIRVAKDIRGDYLVVDQASYTWEEK